MNTRPAPEAQSLSRRAFVKTSALVGAAGLGAGSLLASPLARAGVHTGAGRLKVGVIGCGGRGTGAAVNILEASPDTELWSLGDVFPDRIASCRNGLAQQQTGIVERTVVPAERSFSGFDAYQRVLEARPDIVILATPPHFRPIHLAAAVERGCHVFMEKPVAVDPAGIRSVLASADAAASKGLSIVAGTQRRHEASYLAAMERVRAGAIGRIVGASCYWNQGGLWMNQRRPEWSDMEWQLRNWLYFTWLSGDHIVEQHVHNLDAVNWAIGATPLRCWGMGGRQVRTGPEYGHIFDHFAVEYEYPGGATVQSFCRQIEGCSDRVEEIVLGTDGRAVTSPGRAQISGRAPWQFSGENPNPYVEEHRVLVNAITSGGGRPVNEARQVAESTLTAIMGRMAAYTGKPVTWEQALNSKLDLAPPAYELGSLPVAEVAVPGRTPLV